MQSLVDQVPRVSAAACALAELQTQFPPPPSGCTPSWVRATGRLADPTDLEFADDHLDDPDALAAAIDDLLARKPHLASRRPTNEIGQGVTPSTATVDLAAILRRRAQ